MHSAGNNCDLLYPSQTHDSVESNMTNAVIAQVVTVLKKELQKTQQKDLDRVGEYRQLLVACIHTCATKFPDTAASVIHPLLDFLGDVSTVGALDVAFFIREIIEINEGLRATVLPQLSASFYQIRSTRVATCILWVLSEYSEGVGDLCAALDTVASCIGPLPFITKTDGALAPLCIAVRVADYFVRISCRPMTASQALLAYENAIVC